MDKKVKDLWVAALRSGKFKQTTGQLRRFDGSRKEDAYCCLGVLCALAPEDVGQFMGNEFFWDEYPDQYDEDYAGPEESVERSEGGELPRPVRNWAGMYGTTGERRGGRHKSLVHLNDDAGLNFLDIADYIEANYEHL